MLQFGKRWLLSRTRRRPSMTSLSTWRQRTVPGSQTSNGVLLRALFKMGIPISGKNLFPSNIQGLPTWYIIRLSKDGFLARREKTDIQVCMNGRTVAEDMETAVPGGIVLYDDSLPVANHRKDVTYYPMPVKDLVKKAGLPHALRDYVSNMVYVGVLTELLGIDPAEVEAALLHHFEGKEKAARLNMDMVEGAIDWASGHVVRQDGYRIERMSGFNEGKILVDGNTAGALGALAGGLSLVSWYPITPSSSLAESIEKYAPALRTDPDMGKSTVAVIQAEDELAAMGMVVGAGWTGARAMTCTSGPGISLMAEFAGLSYFAEVPAVIWDIQRMGPSTGLPTRTSQGDIHAAYYLSHGDTKHVVLFPATPAECFGVWPGRVRPGGGTADTGIGIERSRPGDELAYFRTVRVFRRPFQARQGTQRRGPGGTARLMGAIQGCRR